MLSALLWAGFALAGDCPSVGESIATLRGAGERASYECLAQDDQAEAPLIAALAEGGEGAERLSRALALFRLYHMEAEIPAEEARALLPPDRRLLADGIHAFRGRASPAEEHRLVLEQLPWYKPNPAYTDSRLTDLDRRNLEMVNNPPPAPVEPKPSAADAMGQPAAGLPKPAPSASGGGCRVGFCGCSSAPGGAFAALALAGLALLRRQRA